MRVETTTRNLYKFDELSEEAKTHALEKQGEFNAQVWSSSDAQYSLVDYLAEQGFPNAEIFYSGFGSQGDGASFDAGFDHAILLPRFLEDYIPKTSKRALTKAIELEYFTFAIIKNHRANHHAHENTRLVELDYNFEGPSLIADIGSYLDWLETLRHDLSQEIYRDLEKDYLYSFDPERCKEDIEANEYEFTEDGGLA